MAVQLRWLRHKLAKEKVDIILPLRSNKRNVAGGLSGLLDVYILCNAVKRFPLLKSVK